MNNAWKIVIGVVIGFVAVFGFPFYYNLGKANVAPKLKYDTPAILEYEKEHGKKECVEPKEFMAKEHMQLLNTWRDEVVRYGQRIYVNSRGESFHISLQNTCLNCHSNKKEFCDKCHNYLAVNPYCFSCHIVPKEKQS